ncbi:phosphoribosylaminoimidazole carboxylase [Sistotremastrum suecicum HHB10207 ss-3]|uniref:Phosphoribosylaminoimidazole carboxylase n=1 Tax=Sistotremastrum suecicum HHB10207 ss-3 TaxID=1314776 RepID=A0A166DMX3_9AGAM|nr:phosphoribosylaminoimidazole carboxylase [Sistotremastrum suecicum HHB10207 ss-3]
MDSRKVGVLGGGQLGRMLAAEASLLNIELLILDVGPSAPAKQILAHDNHIDGSFSDPTKIRELASKVDILTVEIEHVNVDILSSISSSPDFKHLQIHPSPDTIRIIQDKYVQKRHLEEAGCPVSKYLGVEATEEGVQGAINELGLPLMLKSRKLAYDGRGNYAIHSPSDIPSALSALQNRTLYAEKWVTFEKEIAVMVVRSASGEIRSYPTVETVHKDNICQLVFAPLRVDNPTVEERARIIAEEAVRTFTGAGVFGVEMFLLEDGTIYINEIAPRPHNSGHYTIEACHSSQYSNHLRAILSLPLGSTSLKVPSSAMLNIIGTSSSFSDVQALSTQALSVPGATVHLYGKSESRKGRKMGHITLVAHSDAELIANLRPLLLSSPALSSLADKYTPAPPAQGGHSHSSPLISIIMGSDSDLPTLLPASTILHQFSIPHELTIVSAHRTPARLTTFAKNAASRGVKVIIAGAGGAAHLPGMVAAECALPVIGVPVKGSTLDGVDSLYSIVQMPVSFFHSSWCEMVLMWVQRGIPVATVAINNSTNAALLAIRILSAGDPRLVKKMEEYLKGLESEVMGKVEKLENVGWHNYVVKK